MGDARAVLERISKSQNFDRYRHEHWHGSFDEYPDIVRKIPEVTCMAYLRLYDMILAYGTTPVEGSKDGWILYRFFDDPENGRSDAIFGLARPLMEIVNVFRSAALKYGSERRVLLLRGPAGNLKSTIAWIQGAHRKFGIRVEAACNGPRSMYG